MDVRPTKSAARAALVLALLLSACGGGSSGPSDASMPSDRSDPPDAPAEADAFDGVPVTLRFDGRVGDEVFACGGSYEGIGVSATTLETHDFRFFVHALELVRADGTRAPVRLTQDGMWQLENVALLDFEDGSGPCEGGNPQLNSQVVGTVAEGDYVGVRFLLGVPFELNHADHVVAPPPLNLTSMFWSWNGGYKFFRFDGATTGQPDGLRVHLGSTGCEADPGGEVTSCARPNRAEVVLDGFDPQSSTIVADLARLFAESDLDTNATSTPPGCMGSPSDMDCAPIFTTLGLSGAGAEQSVFRVE